MKTLTLSALALAAILAMPAAAPARADALSSTRSDGIATAFDGTPIVYSLFLPAGATGPVPAVLYTHGWAGSRDTNQSAGSMIDSLSKAGFAVLTWDARGFGQSGGFIELDSPAYEVRDAQKMIDLLAGNPAILQDGAGDPRVGMTGSSYAGGIQLLTAAFDARVDAITPDITWNDLRESLGPGGVPKELWIQVLFGAGAGFGEANGLGLTTSGFGQNPAGPQATSYDANLPLWYAEVHATNGVTADVAEGLRERSPTAYATSIHVPTLLTQGLPDTLFNPNQAVANYRAIQANGEPVKLVMGCFGHAGCPTGYASDPATVRAAIVQWLVKYVADKGDVTAQAAIDTGLPVQWQDNAGAWHREPAWGASATPATAAATFTLASTPAPVGGGGYCLGVGVSACTPDEPVTAGNANLALPGTDGKLVAGIGKVHVGITGVGTEAFLFLRLLDVAPDGSSSVIDGQTQAYRVPITPFSTSQADVDLVGVGYQLAPGHTLSLQVSTSDVSHATNRQPGVYTVTIGASVPVAG